MYIVFAGIQIITLMAITGLPQLALWKQVAVYDSRFIGGLSLERQVAMIYRSLVIQEEDGDEVDPHILVHIPAVPQQSGKTDCGVFAVAFALHCLVGDNLADIEFEQSQMRHHLLDCLKKKTLTRFPTKPTRGKRPNHFPYREVELFCTCLMHIKLK